VCAVCADNYFPDQGECQECTDAHMLTTTMIMYLSIALVVVGSLLAAAYFKYLRGESIEDRMLEIASRASTSSSGGSSRSMGFLDAGSQSRPPEKGTGGEAGEKGGRPGGEVLPPSRWELMALWVHERYDRLMVKLKIIIVTFQVVSSVPASLEVSMPRSFTKFLDTFNFLDLSLSAAFPVRCSSRFTYIDQLVLTTFVPFAIVLVLIIAFFVEYAHQRRIIQKNQNRKAGEKAAKFNEVKDRYLNYVFYLTYLVMPSVTTTIFATFICTSIDPDNETGEGDDLYLVADMSISCHSDYYRGGVVYACIMIVVYPGERAAASRLWRAHVRGVCFCESRSGSWPLTHEFWLLTILFCFAYYIIICLCMCSWHHRHVRASLVQESS
jgi:hypothetical protein